METSGDAVACSSKRITIYVKQAWKSPPDELTVPRSHTIEDVKQLLQPGCNDKSKMQLFFGRLELDDNSTLCSNGIEDGDSLYLWSWCYFGACFQRDTVALVPATPDRTAAGTTIGDEGRSIMASAVPRPMALLRAGDKVLVSDPETGRVYADRVSINLHTRDRSQAHTGVVLRHEKGVVSVTDDHLMLVARNGEAGGRSDAIVPAGRLKVGDELIQAGTDHASKVLEITRWRGGIINPLTHSGRILAAAATPSSAPGSAAPDPASFVLATTFLASPGNVLGTLVVVPSFFKLGSLLFPQQLQDSATIDFALNTVASSAALLQRLLDWEYPNTDRPATAAAAALLSKPAFTFASGAQSLWKLGEAPRLAMEAAAFATCALSFLLFDLAIGVAFLLYHGAIYMLAAVPVLLLVVYQLNQPQMSMALLTPTFWSYVWGAARSLQSTCPIKSIGRQGR